MQTEIIKALMGAAGAVGGATYVDDVFSTYLWEGNATTRDINNGIDLAGEGGLVWIKNRENGNQNNLLFDTTAPPQSSGNLYSYPLQSNTSVARGPSVNGLKSFNSNGFSVYTDSGVNENDKGIASWTFRKAPGFFDVVTYTGTSSTLNVAHNLGCVPGCILIKCTDQNGYNWQVYHRGIGNTKSLKLDSTDAEITGNYFNDTSPTSTHFTVGATGNVNYNGFTYVAYVFAHDEQSFGEDANSSVIKCGSYTTDSNEDATINLGWEPQWVLAKRTDSSTGGDWFIIDSMRGFMNAQDIEANNGGSKYVEPNTSDAEADTSRMGLTSTGFYADQFGSNRTFIYMAIRRSDGYVGKPVELGTDVFAMAVANGSTPSFISNFPVDWALMRMPSTANNWSSSGRLAPPDLQPDNSNAEDTSLNSVFKFDHNNGWAVNRSSPRQSWMWKRHAGFDVVAYTGNGSEHHSIYHSLNNTPQMIWIKRRDSSANWHVFHIGLNGGSAPQDRSINLNLGSPESTNAAFNDYLPTSNQFKVGLNNETNANNGKFLAILFGSVENISKVGYYSGSNSSQTITTGFQPRFVIIRRNNTTQDWVLLDTLRGWASGNDTRLELNQSAAQNNNTDFGAPISTGFTLEGATAKCNASGGEFIYYAHA